MKLGPSCLSNSPESNTGIITRLKSVSAKLKVLIVDEDAGKILLECGCNLSILTDIGYIGKLLISLHPTIVAVASEMVGSEL